MKTMLINTLAQIEGGSEFHAQEGFGGCVEISERKRFGRNPQMTDGSVILRIPKEKREALANFLKEAK